jgi:hypothetical protein
VFIGVHSWLTWFDVRLRQSRSRPFAVQRIARFSNTKLRLRAQKIRFSSCVRKLMQSPQSSESPIRIGLIKLKRHKTEFETRSRRMTCVVEGSVCIHKC